MGGCRTREIGECRLTLNPEIWLCIYSTLIVTFRLADCSFTINYTFICDPVRIKFHNVIDFNL